MSPATSDLVDTHQVAAIAGVAYATVRKWRARHAGFPAPVPGYRHPLFRRIDVLRWLERTGRVRQEGA